ncbi:phenylalanine--tRNA ligase subunit beta [Dethiobacter alkaliphilus]|uniref:phenylalanine--tRNA ligase subunit beta n=1 Tax=Dethiobacter alkaliphilus TaxID=427926 RepID=UPI002225D010|nr:phenylalanine--tRNA ligase subunit beta [Dethiobacter alkaliphilus]MCW3491177.1 phenylalanine--tRNA ligase subunit beta [Dethiobacter alkaliphilus]
MRVPYTWLKDFIDLEHSAQELAEMLTNAGIEVEEITTLKPAFTNVVVAEVKSLDKHPEADKLFVVQVHDGTEESTVVAGINNFSPGDKVPLAKPGARLPGDLKIRRTKLRGIESNGMLCSAEELGLELNPGVHGILVLDGETPVGAPLEEALYLNDPVLVLGLTPNRADCLGLLGVAHEVAALTGKAVQMPDTSLPVEKATQPVPKISIEDENLCARYAGLVLSDIRVDMAPVWMQIRLLQAGVRPISNIVDITNYVMWEWGQPLHAFDYHTLAEHSIVVRKAREGEVMVTLDDQERELTSEMLVIADAKEPVALAGVMGGLATEVTAATDTVLLESAHFNPVSIRRTGRSLGMYSEAQQRFEKGVDVNGCGQAIRRAARLIDLLNAGRVNGDVVDEYVAPQYPKKIRLRPDRARQLIGLEISQLEMSTIFQRQGFKVEEGTQLHVTAPTRRADLQEEVDLIEEVARIHGYDKIGTTLPSGTMTQGRRTEKQRAIKKVRETLISCGLAEVINYSFVSPQMSDKLRIPAESQLRKAVAIANPLSEEQSVMRTLLTGGLLETLSYNSNRNEQNIKVFELGAVYLPKELPLVELPEEKTILGIAMTGEFPKEHWRHKPVSVDFFDVKGVVETVLSVLGIDGVQVTEAELPWCQPGQTALLYLDNEELGWIGRVHPEVADEYDLEKPVYLAELDLAKLLDKASLITQYTSLPRYPAVLRDIAVVVPDSVSAAEVIELMRDAGGSIVEDITLFDLYRGPQIPEGSRSLAFAVTYRDAARTLSDDVVSREHQKIEEALASRFGASLRR